MSVTILGTKVDTLTAGEVVEQVGEFVRSNDPHYIVTPNPEILVRAFHDPEFQAVINHADIAVPDGVGLMLAARLTGKRIPQRIPGSDLVYRIAERAAEENWSIYLLGGEGSTPAQAAQRLRREFPALRIAGVSNAKIADPKHPPVELIESIQASHADILFVGLGAGKQEFFIYHSLDRLPRVRLAVGVGGSLDFLAGRVPRAPQPVRSLGLEWLYRLIRQPSRWRRILTAVVEFPWLVITQRSPRANA